MDASCTIQDSIQLRRLTIVNVSRILGTYHAAERFLYALFAGDTQSESKSAGFLPWMPGFVMV